ncbi:helix-turn-helix domain-containing protein [Cohnella thermotolerans]|uniref:helix-turn-helix domain-containing protein n=1 Tax=Cohnella thermotolerans TaxID=329858 RepID=UPI000A00DE0C|nr:helix-turn-helix domain-containing protein [Cohnella thermotolerans]
MEKLYTVKQASEYMGVHLQTLYRWLREGRISATKPTKRTVRIKESELKRFTRMEGESA